MRTEQSMWVADGWQDYELLDCSRGEKLERWGEVYLVRPDPQAIWDTPRRNRHWQTRNGRYVRSESGGGSWEKGSIPEVWEMCYKDLRFRVRPMNFKHTGLFPEQAANWDWAMEKIRTAGRPVRVLNLFAYTGAATVACLKAGAEVCHVDAAKGMVAWAKENAEASGVSGAPVRWIVDDCLKFVEREIRRSRKYDAIIMDPEQNLWPFVSACAGVLSERPLFVLINSYTTGLSPSVLSYVTESVFRTRFGGEAEARELCLPVTDSGLYLPCGASCRHEF